MLFYSSKNKYFFEESGDILEINRRSGAVDIISKIPESEASAGKKMKHRCQCHNRGGRRVKENECEERGSSLVTGGNFIDKYCFCVYMSVCMRSHVSLCPCTCIYTCTAARRDQVSVLPPRAADTHRSTHTHTHTHTDTHTAQSRHIAGLIGIITLLRGKYLVLNTETRVVGSIEGKKVYEIVGTEVLPFSPSPVQDDLTDTTQRQDEEEYLALLQHFLATTPLLYSKHYDLTNSTQRLASK